MKKERLSKLTKLLHSIPSTNGEELLIKLTKSSEDLGLSENTVERLKTELKDSKGYLDKFFPNIQMDNSISHLLKDNEELKSKLKKWCELELAAIIAEIIGNRKYAMGIVRVLSIKYMESRDSIKSSLVISKLNNKKDNLKDLDESVIIETSGANEVEIFVDDTSQKSSFPIPRYLFIGLIDALAQDSNHPLKEVRLKGIKHKNGIYEIQISNVLDDTWPLPDIEVLTEKPDHDRNVRFWIQCLTDLLPFEEGVFCKINKESKPYSINICWEECDPDKYRTSADDPPTQIDEENLEIAAKQGDVKTQFILAEKYFYGSGMERDYKTAFDLYEKTAKKGSLTACYKLGYLYCSGLGVEPNETKGLEWFIKGADRGCQYSQYRAGFILLYQAHKNDQNIAVDLLGHKRGMDYLVKSAEKGNVEAQMTLGTAEWISIESNIIDSIHWLKKASESNNSNAYLQIGFKYLIGDGLKEDITEALDYFEKAAELENAIAQSKIGEIFYNMSNDVAALQKAVNWFTRAANQGEPKALVKLGLMLLFFEEFKSIEDHDEKAKNNFVIAAETGAQARIISNTEITKDIIQTFVTTYDQYRFKFIDEVSPNKLEKIRHILREFEDHNEPVILYYDSTFIGTGQKVVLMGPDRIAWSNGNDEFLIKPYSWEGFRTVRPQYFGIAFEDHKISVVGMSREPHRKLCTVLEILHQVRNTIPTEASRKIVEESIINSICSQGFPSKNVTMPFKQIFDLCLNNRVSFHGVLDFLSVQQVLNKISDDEITFYTP
jgi:TPR repeat protein